MALTDVAVDESRAGWVAKERPRPDRVRERPGAWKLAVAAVCFGAFMGQLDASVVTLTYRPLQAEFHTGLAAVEWVSLAYLLTLVSLLVPAGRLSDGRGRKLFYLRGFVIFTAASAACGLAPSLGLLVGFRVLQGVGAALLQANSVALVTTSSPPAFRRSALGVQAGAQALGLALGPTVGGVLVSSLGWRWVFFINVPVGIVAWIAGRFVLPRTRQRAQASGWDVPGIALLAAATAAVLVGMSAASGLPVPGGIAAGLFGLGGLAAGGFVARQRRAASPLIDLRLLHDRLVSCALVGALCGYFVLFGPLVLVPIALTGKGVSAVTAGLVLTALPAGFAVAAVAGPALLPSVLSERRRAGLGAVTCTVALATGLAAPFTPAVLAGLLAVTGAGLGLFTPSNNGLIMGAVPAGSSATAGGLLNLARGLGTAGGVAAVTLALHVGRDTQLGGNRVALAVLLVGAATATVVSLAGGPRRRESFFDAERLA